MTATGLRSARSSVRFSRPRRGERGFILVTGLLFLVVMTMLGLALFRGTGLMDRLTTNSRDKQRSFEAAESALEYSAWWLSRPTGPGTPSSCAANNYPDVSTMHVCDVALSTSLNTLGSLSWAPLAYTYTPNNMAVQAGGGMSATNAIDVNYYKPPGVYVENLGLVTSPKGTEYYYQATAYGYGGDANTVSVLRATFKKTAVTKNRGKA